MTISLWFLLAKHILSRNHFNFKLFSAPEEDTIPMLFSAINHNSFSYLPFGPVAPRWGRRARRALILSQKFLISIATDCETTSCLNIGKLSRLHKETIYIYKLRDERKIRQQLTSM